MMQISFNLKHRPGFGWLKYNVYGTSCSQFPHKGWRAFRFPGRVVSVVYYSTVRHRDAYARGCARPKGGTPVPIEAYGLTPGLIGGTSALALARFVGLSGQLR
jgi:hypothetical protein